MASSDKQSGWEIYPCHCITPGAEDMPSYGIGYWEDGKQLWRWEDVDVCHETVLALVQRLRRETPEPVHWEEIVQDYIEEIGK